MEAASCPPATRRPKLLPTIGRKEIHWQVQRHGRLRRSASTVRISFIHIASHILIIIRGDPSGVRLERRWWREGLE
jgi:hypothetical protein